MKLEQSCKGWGRLGQVGKVQRRLWRRNIISHGPEGMKRHNVLRELASVVNFETPWWECPDKKEGQDPRSRRALSSPSGQTAAPHPLRREILKLQPIGSCWNNGFQSRQWRNVRDEGEREMLKIAPVHSCQKPATINYWELTVCSLLCWTLNIQRWMKWEPSPQRT